MENVESEPLGRGIYARSTNRGKRLVPASITFPPAMLTELDTQATLRGLDNRSEIVRIACAEYLNRPAQAA
jgi:hypothetical protein